MEKNNGSPYISNSLAVQKVCGICRQLMENGYEDVIKEKTGSLSSIFFMARKFNGYWTMYREPGKERKKVSFCRDSRSWLSGKLTAGAVHITDYTNAFKDTAL